MLKTETATQKIASLSSISAHGDDFSTVISNLQKLYSSLRQNSSSRGKNNYLCLLAYLLENYLDSPKQLSLRRILVRIIASQSKDKYAAQYFKRRLAHTEMLELLEHHHNLTGKWLILDETDCLHQKFKIKQV